MEYREEGSIEQTHIDPKNHSKNDGKEKLFQYREDSEQESLNEKIVKALQSKEEFENIK